MDLFFESGTDPREVTALFPNIELPAANPEAVSVPDHGVKSIGNLAKTPEERLQAREGLVAYLEAICSSPSLHRDSIVAADMALVQVLAFLRSPRLVDVLGAPNCCVVEHCAAPLTKNECHHSLAIGYAQHGRPQQALAVWRRLDAGELADSAYPGGGARHRVPRRPAGRRRRVAARHCFPEPSSGPWRRGCAS